MKLDEVAEFFETKDYKEANIKLKAGFRPIKILSSKSTESNTEDIRAMYILGKKKEE